MAYDDRALRGVGGWLAFFVLSLAVFSPLRAVIELVTLLGDPQITAFYGPRWPWMRGYVVADFLLGVGGALFIAWRLVYRQDRATLRIATMGIWLISLLPLLVGIAVVAAIASLPLGDVTAGVAADLARSLVYCAVWTAYLLKSRRVANTYANEPADELHAVFE